MSIPAWATSLVSSLPDETQQTVLKYGARAMMDPWFVCLAGIPAAWTSAYVPHGIMLGVVVPLQLWEYNNRTPREVNFGDKVKPTFLGQLANRCRYAHMNGLEAFPLFACAVILAKIQKASGKEIQPLVMRFLFIRTIYNALYILGVHDVIAACRTVVWMSGVQTCLQIYAKALGAGMN